MERRDEEEEERVWEIDIYPERQGGGEKVVSGKEERKRVNTWFYIFFSELYVNNR